MTDPERAGEEEVIFKLINFILNFIVYLAGKSVRGTTVLIYEDG